MLSAYFPLFACHSPVTVWIPFKDEINVWPFISQKPHKPLCFLYAESNKDESCAGEWRASKEIQKLCKKPKYQKSKVSVPVNTQGSVYSGCHGDVSIVVGQLSGPAVASAQTRPAKLGELEPGSIGRTVKVCGHLSEQSCPPIIRKTMTPFQHIFFRHTRDVRELPASLTASYKRVFPPRF